MRFADTDLGRYGRWLRAIRHGLHNLGMVNVPGSPAAFFAAGETRRLYTAGHTAESVAWSVARGGDVHFQGPVPVAAGWGPWQ